MGDDAVSMPVAFSTSTGRLAGWIAPGIPAGRVPIVDDPRWAVLDLVEPATWTVSKTEAIDAASDFWRVNDDLAKA